MPKNSKENLKMKLNQFVKSGYLIAAMVALPALAAAAPKECVAGKPTAQSYTWNFDREASRLLSRLEQDSLNARMHAATLQTFDENQQVHWQTHASELMSIKRDINDMGSKLCRLETIRRVVEPWQQQAIDRVAPQIRLMADNEGDALTFLNNNHEYLWAPTYRKYADNLYSEASQVSHSVNNYEELAKLHKENRQLQENLGTKSGL